MQPCDQFWWNWHGDVHWPPTVDWLLKFQKHHVKHSSALQWQTDDNVIYASTIIPHVNLCFNNISISHQYLCDAAQCADCRCTKLLLLHSTCTPHHTSHTRHVVHFAWLYSPTAASTVQHLSSCWDNIASATPPTRHPLHTSFGRQFEPPSVAQLSLLLPLQPGTASWKQSVLHASLVLFRKSLKTDCLHNHKSADYINMWPTVFSVLCSMT